MDAKTPASLSEPYLPLDLPKTPGPLPRGVDTELWRIAHRFCPPGQEWSIELYSSMARTIAVWFTTRSMPIGDAATWLQRHAESCDLPKRFGEDKVQLALELAFESVREEEDEASDEERSPEFSDDALATSFAIRHKDELRYVAAWGRWFLYDGMSWREDDTLHAFDLSRQVCREAAAIPNNKSGLRAALASAKTVSAIERLAKADRRLAASVGQWDADPLLLNTPGGVVDLRTGELGRASPYQYMTKVTAVAPSGTCPIFQRFLARVTNEDLELQRFLQRVAGYALTGLTSEHSLFFCYGTGANGKSVLINTFSEILGNYHKTAAIETFTVSTVEHHPTDIAGLRGARFVTSIETEEGRRWAEAKIKNLTGGDKISARFMRQDFFEFTPQFKLLIAGNHKPSLKSVDEAIRRRFHLIPFVVTIPPGERDRALPEKLKAEWPGILAWMIEGCLAWQREGLSPPSAVLEATAAYLDAEDSIANWFADSCECDPRSYVNSSVLFGSWSAWCERSNESPGSQKGFSDKLEAKGFRKDRLGKAAGGRGFHGIRVVDHGRH
jgi:putative DNA primase/helicase